MEHDLHDMNVKVRDGAAIWRDIDGETVLLALNSSLYLGLNRTGTALWPLMVEGTTRNTMINRLVVSFGIDRDRAGSDVDSFIAACDDQRLLVPMASPQDRNG